MLWMDAGRARVQRDAVEGLVLVERELPPTARLAPRRRRLAPLLQLLLRRPAAPLQALQLLLYLVFKRL